MSGDGGRRLRLPRTLPRVARPLLHPQYRMLAVALTLSLVGVGIWVVALVFQVREVGGGPIELSFVATLNAIGLVVAVLVGGAIADRIPQRLILLAVEITKTVVITAAGVLGVTGLLEIWHLAVFGLVLGLLDGFFYPAYSALLPSTLPPGDLLAANGIEGMLRPALMNAAGPLLASLFIAIASPATAFLAIGITQLGAIAALSRMRTTPVQRDLDGEPRRHPLHAMVVDIAAGVGYMVRTPWLFATLVFASFWVLVMLGPMEVLLPFAVADQTGGGARAYALVLTAYGVGSAAASLVVASMRMPRRYLTVMILAWGLGCLPFTLVGFTDQLWLMVVIGFIVGSCSALGQVIWSTLLQRRVPTHMLGRVSSLDFFVSLVFMPISMALAGPVGERLGFGPTFAIAGALPVVFAVVAIVAARMTRDEIEHPLDTGEDMAGLGAVEMLEPVPADDAAAAQDGDVEAEGDRGGSDRAENAG